LGIPDSILNKKPSADLWEGQSDEEELGYTYKHMDDALKEIVDKGKSKEDILKEGFEEDLIDMLQRRIKANAFKGKMPIIADINWS
jgi:NAD+ synthase